MDRLESRRSVTTCGLSQFLRSVTSWARVHGRGRLRRAVVRTSRMSPQRRSNALAREGDVILVVRNDLFYTRVMRADIVVFDGLDELDALGPYEILRRAEHLSIDFSVRLVSHTGQDTVCGSSGLTFATDGQF